jgi:hypothetical protein
MVANIGGVGLILSRVALPVPDFALERCTALTEGA